MRWKCPCGRENLDTKKCLDCGAEYSAEYNLKSQGFDQEKYQKARQEEGNRNLERLPSRLAVKAALWAWGFLLFGSLIIQFNTTELQCSWMSVIFSPFFLEDHNLYVPFKYILLAVLAVASSPAIGWYTGKSIGKLILSGKRKGAVLSSIGGGLIGIITSNAIDPAILDSSIKHIAPALIIVSGPGLILGLIIGWNIGGRIDETLALKSYSPAHGKTKTEKEQAELNISWLPALIAINAGAGSWIAIMLGESFFVTLRGSHDFTTFHDSQIYPWFEGLAFLSGPVIGYCTGLVIREFILKGEKAGAVCGVFAGALIGLITGTAIYPVIFINPGLAGFLGTGPGCVAGIVIGKITGNYIDKKYSQVVSMYKIKRSSTGSDVDRKT
ncbi:MAG: hypothetical protein PHW04_06615 [Candidatus Wallbacteria bacterium]|nr:hypothetical protein [Candidatus Wallbacteria bacterium]